MDLRRWQDLLTPPGLAGLFGYAAEPGEYVRGNRLRLLVGGGEAYPRMLEAITQARDSVHLETYTFESDDTGWVFARALAAAAKRGVDARLICDAVGSRHMSEESAQFLRNAGVRLLFFRPVAPWRRRWGWAKRDHRKILAVDGRVAFTGGLNIGDEYAEAETGGGGWRDLQVEAEGPAAWELDRLFRRLWYQETGKWFALPAAPPTAGGALACVTPNHRFLHRFLIRRAYVHALARAQKSVLIANAYFIPDRRIRAALLKARRRGVEVKILVPEMSDVPAATYAGRYLYDRLLDGGLRLFAWRGPMLHAKAMVIDGTWGAVGSYNFTHRSLHHNLEVNLHVLDPRFGGELEQALAADIDLAHEIEREAWRARPYADKVKERFFYLLRYLF